MKPVSILLFASAASVFAAPCGQTVHSGDLSFHIVARDSLEGIQVTTSPSGLKNSNDQVSFEGEGTLTKTFL